MFKKKTLFFMLIFIIQLSAQDSGYPLPILGGQTIQTPATQDTLWILKNSQYKNMLKKAKVFSLSEAQLSLLHKKIKLQQDVINEKDTLAAIYKEGFNHYLTLWKETDGRLEKARIEASRRWLYLELGIIGGALATLLLILPFTVN